MMRGRLLLVLWCSVILGAVSSSFRADHYSCATDYLNSIRCDLNISDDLGFMSNNYSLKFTQSGSSSSCPLMARAHGYHCDCKVNTDGFASFYVYSIELCNNSICSLMESRFDPSKRIKLTPPPEVELQQTSDTINITCKSKAYENHTYLSHFLIFEVLLQDSLSRQNKTLHLDSSQHVEFLDKSELEPNTDYCVKARFMPDKKIKTYKATWSEWSESVCLKNKAEEEASSEQENIRLILLKFLSPLCVLAGFLLVIFYSPVVRMKIKTLAHTPSPAPFFKPLFQKHEGNIQDWLSHQSQFNLPFKTEKDLIVDAVTVVPKPTMKDPEESQPFLGVSLPHLTFPQSPTSYVGLPVMAEAPPSVTTICTGNTPYTQLPCSVWGFIISDVEVVSSAPKDFLEMSHTDSGCSCEDLTKSPECSLPSSPVNESWPPHYCTDYCILNKTAEGVVPVLLSKESNKNLPPDPLKTEG